MKLISLLKVHLRLFCIKIYFNNSICPYLCLFSFALDIVAYLVTLKHSELLEVEEKVALIDSVELGLLLVLFHVFTQCELFFKKWGISLNCLYHLH